MEQEEREEKMGFLFFFAILDIVILFIIVFTCKHVDLLPL